MESTQVVPCPPEILCPIARLIAVAHAGVLVGRPPVIDLLVAVAATAAAGAVLLVRGRWPSAVVVMVTVVSWAYLVLGYAGGAELPLVMVAV